MLKHEEMIKILKHEVDVTELLIVNLEDVTRARIEHKDTFSKLKSKVEALNQAITLLENQRWRKPSEEMPEQGKEVLVKFASGDSFSVAVFCDGEWLIEDEYRHETSDFLGWMPIYEEGE